MPKTRTSGLGRPKGVPNKFTGDIKAMILAALDKVGGLDYLAQQAIDNPTAFMSLVGRVLPMQLNVDAKISLEMLVTQAVNHATMIEAAANDVSDSDSIIRH